MLSRPTTASARPRTAARAVLLAFAAATMLSLLGLETAVADQLSVHPASCQAPFLDQARPMRWHENYIMNPDTNQATYVICPISYNFGTSFSAGSTVSIAVYGAAQSTASSQAPQCFFSVAGADNLLLAPYINIQGGDRTFTQPLQTQLGFPQWLAQGSISSDSVANALQNTNPAFRNAAVFCLLPTGYGISTISINMP